VRCDCPRLERREQQACGNASQQPPHQQHPVVGAMFGQTAGTVGSYIQ
jgi:hypothetical protein